MNPKSIRNEKEIRFDGRYRKDQVIITGEMTETLG